MAKNQATAESRRNGATRDRAPAGKALSKGVRREILFPTERTTIGHKKIDRAVERVVSRKK